MLFFQRFHDAKHHFTSRKAHFIRKSPFVLGQKGFFVAEDEGFDGRFAFGANRKEQSASSCRLARLRRSLALDGFESRKTSEQKEETPEGVSSWQRMRDSMADLPLGQIVRSNRHRAADWQGSAGALHWMGSNPAKLQKRKMRHLKASLLGRG